MMTRPEETNEWRVLVVDDDDDMLAISVMVLSSVRLDGQAIVVDTCNSSAEARRLLKVHRYAVAVIDVVMESTTDGLQLVRDIRDRDQMVRIILRTGQPGSAPERAVLDRYDINDYLHKLDGAAERLRTTVIGLLRSYRDLCALEESRRMMASTIDALKVYLRDASTTELVDRLFHATCEVLGRPLRGVVVAMQEGFEAPAYRILADRTDSRRESRDVNEALTAAETKLLDIAVADGGFAIEGEVAAAAVSSPTVSGTLGVIVHGWSGLSRERELLGELLLRNTLSAIERVSARRAERERLERLAHYDETFGMLNRRGLMEAIEEAQTMEGPRTLLIFDIANLEQVNLSFGAEVGDRTLMVLRDQLTLAGCSRCHFARLSGEKFAALLRARDFVSAQRYSTRVTDGVANWWSHEGVRLPLKIHVGAVLLAGTGADAALRMAYAALEEAHRSNRMFAVCDEDLLAKLTRSAALQQRAQDASSIIDGARLVYQPIIDLSSSRWSGVEALLRWESDEFGPVRPDVLIDLANRTGVIHELGAWIIRMATEQIAALPGDLTLSVNLSTPQFSRDELYDAIDVALQVMAPDRLTLEVTEQISLYPGATTSARMLALRERGVTIALDDFGTGYSSLGYLLGEDFDQLKLDRSFVRDLPDSARSARLTAAVHALCGSLGLTGVAEGIETARQADWLAQLGIRFGQGFFFARPMEYEQLREVVERGDVHVAWSR